MSLSPNQINDRDASKSLFAGFDGVRAVAAVGVVALHAGVPYLVHPMPGLTWSVRDSSSPAVDFMFWSIELVVMPIFLVIAGYLALQSLERGGPSTLVRNRAKRLLIPLLFGIVVVLPVGLQLWVLGWVSDGLVLLVKLRSLKFDGVIDRDLWGLSHLWFLQYLFLYVVLLALVRRAVVKFAKTNATVLMVGWLAIASVVLFFRPNVVWGFQHAFAPVMSKFLYHGLFFVVGVSLAIRDPGLGRLKALAPRLAIPGVLFAIATVRFGQWHLANSQNILNEHSAVADIALALLTPFSAIMLTLACIGLAVARVIRLPVAMQYLAAASFWIYLVHHPLLGLIHIDLKYLMPSLSAAVKAIVACGLSLFVSIATYEAFVRRTRLGRTLGFAFQLPGEQQDLGEAELRHAELGSVLSIEAARNAARPVARDDACDSAIDSSRDQPRRAA